MALMDKTAAFEGVLQFWDRVLRWGPIVIGTGATAWLTGWATKITGAFSEYSPASYVFAGLVGGCLFLAGLALFHLARVNLEKAKFARRFSEQHHSVNPLESVFTRQRVDINVFKTATNDIAPNKTLVDCELRGPAVVAFLNGASFSGCEFINCDFVKTRKDAVIANAIPFSNLTVHGGRVISLTILVPEAIAASIPAGANWLTS